MDNPVLSPKKVSTRLSAEIHFHEQEKASIFLESNVFGNEEKLGEIGLLAMFAMRIMSNLGVHQVRDDLATILTGAPIAIHQLAKGNTTGGLQLITYPGFQGRKRFLVDSRMSDDRWQFHFQAKGFGLLARGMGYYGPVAVLALLRYLSLRRPDDNEFLRCLSNAAAMSGQIHLSREIRLGNHSQLAAYALVSACPDYFP